MSSYFIPSLLVPLVGFLSPLLIIIFFLQYVDKELVD